MTLADQASLSDPIPAHIYKLGKLMRAKDIDALRAMGAHVDAHHIDDSAAFSPLLAVKLKAKAENLSHPAPHAIPGLLVDALELVFLIAKEAGIDGQHLLGLCWQTVEARGTYDRDGHVSKVICEPESQADAFLTGRGHTYKLPPRPRATKVKKSG